ncbi:MAG: fasciclin domain-containing protein [Spirosoma sp.]|nr:fasciclin domain-containing protein [Spirosoma sp.]
MQAKQTKISFRLSVPVLAVLSVLSVAFYSCKNEDNPATQNQGKTITDVIVTNNTDFTLVEAAVIRAGLAGTLAGTGPFTLFAPTDAAFKAAGYADAAAINAVPAATLSNILLYHVISGSALTGSSIQTGQYAQQTAGTGKEPLFVNKTGTAVSVNGARVTTADISATNGVVHAIDKLLMPPTGTVLAVAQADTSLSYLTAAAVRGGTAVTSALSGSNQLTVFAPTNAAFRTAGFPTIASINAAPVATLTTVLTNHVIPSVRAFSPTLVSGPVTTFGGGSVTVTVGSNNAVTLLSKGNGTNAATVTTADINATNGVIHKINRVLLP